MRVEFELTASAAASLDVNDSTAAGSKLRFLAAVKLYEMHRLSVGAAAEVAGMEMGAFLAAFQALSGAVQ